MPILDNSRHEAFAQAIVKGLNATEAYKSVGYEAKGNAAESAASRLLSDVRVTARIQELQARAADGVVVSKQWVLERLIENANRAMQAEAALDDDGKPVGEYRYDGSVANRALELVGKELGMFIDRKEVRTGALDGASPDTLTEVREQLVAERSRRADRGVQPGHSGKPH